MSAPKTNVASETKEIKVEPASKNGVQLIVFSPINADPNDEDSKIYMVCPSSLKVIEVVEKGGDEADEYIQLLGKHKTKTSLPATDFVDELGDSSKVSDDMIIDNSGTNLADIEIDDLKSLESELDEDIVTFASEALGDIFPDSATSGSNSSLSDVSDVDLTEALALLDQDDDESGLDEFTDFKADDDSLPAL